MPALITKSYPSLLDVYARITEVNEETGETINTWDYDNPVPTPCNVVAINPQDSLERFGETYTKKVFLKIEVPRTLNFSDRVGNLRNKAQTKFYYTELDNPMIFNVSGLSSQVDIMGNLVAYEAYLEYAGILSD